MGQLLPLHAVQPVSAKPPTPITMTPSIRFLLRLTLGAATGLASTLNAADWYLQANSGLSQHWHTPAAWAWRV